MNAYVRRALARRRALRALGGGDSVRVGRRLLVHAREEERLVDAALEDWYAHLHALLDHLTALESRLAGQLRGRQVNRHRSVSSREVCHVVQGKVSRWADVLNEDCST